MHETETQSEPDLLQASVHEIVELCGGDPFAAIKALIVANEFLEKELALTQAAVSQGYSRGWHARRKR